MLSIDSVPRSSSRLWEDDSRPIPGWMKLAPMALVRDAAAPPGDGCDDGIGRAGAALARRRIRPCGHRSTGLRAPGDRYAKRGRQRSGSRRTRGLCGARRFRGPDCRAVAHSPPRSGTAGCHVAQRAGSRGRKVVGELSQQFRRDCGGHRRVLSEKANSGKIDAAKCRC